MRVHIDEKTPRGCRSHVRTPNRQSDVHGRVTGKDKVQTAIRSKIDARAMLPRCVIRRTQAAQSHCHSSAELAYVQYVYEGHIPFCVAGRDRSSSA